MTPLFLASAISDSIPASIHSVLPGGILTLADAAARALLVACVVAVGLRLLAPRHVPAQKTAWGLVLAGALLMPVLAPWAGKATWLPSGATWVVPVHTWSQLILSRAASLMPPKTAVMSRPTPDPSAATYINSDAPAVAERTDVVLPASAQGDRFPAPTVSYVQTAGADPAPAGPARTTYYLPVSDLAWMVYGAVCFALLLRLAYGLGGAIGLWQSAEPVPLDPHLTDGLPLRASCKVSSPVTVGSGVVLPADYDEWDIEKLRIVLAHERSHVHQGDFYLQALAGLYTAIFWFSPLGWWMKRKLSDLSETISDRAGLEEAASHASYAQILLEFAAMPRRTEVGVAMARTGHIAQRIERLLNEHSFRQAFAGGQRRLWTALVLVPTVLFAATALIRVEAAVTLQQPASVQGPVIGQSHPESIPDASQANTPVPPASAQAPAHPAAPPANTNQEPSTPAPPPADTPAPPSAAPQPAPGTAPKLAPVPPPPADSSDEEGQDQTVTTT
ncbi:MAG TPA: M56 family metallopeptidase, partial [Aggregatilineaceae bacterium]|nr:M56 family metallopeptidase [Aggregatilineaceae bacterium]